MWLLIPFIAIPLIEIALFIQIGGAIGLGWTLAIVLLTAVLGTWLVRSQGAIALGQVKSSFSDLRDPTEPLVHGAMILFSGALLLTPGFFTDAIGFSLLVPAIRRAVFQAIQSRMSIHSFGTQQGGRPTRGQGGQPRPEPMRPSARHAGQGDVIDGEFHEIEDDARQGKEGSSGWTKH